MRYSAADKLEIIRMVEQSHLPARRTLEQIGVPRATFYRWYDLYAAGGPEALADRPSRPERIWNRIPEAVRVRIVALALEEAELSSREIAVRFTDQERYFVSEASHYFGRRWLGALFLGFPNRRFGDSWRVGCWGADHGGRGIGLARGT